MNHVEDKSISLPFKKEYYDGLDALIRKRQAEAKTERDGFFQDIINEPEKYRQKLCEMLGWPLVNYELTAPAKVTESLVSEEDGYNIYRMSFEILDGLKMTGLLFKQNRDEKKPLVIVQHGGGGTPEFLSGMHGSTSNYNDMLHRVLCHGVHVFAPQLLLWNDDYGLPRDRLPIDARLKRVGSSLTAIEVFGIKRILDHFETMPYVSKFGMVGLSYGGFYTLFVSALDTRILSSVSAAYFNGRDDVTFVDWTWFRSAYLFDDAEVAALVYPRRISIHVADNDELFKPQFGVEQYERLKKNFLLIGDDWLEFNVFEGKHEFPKYDYPIERLINDLNK